LLITPPGRWPAGRYSGSVSVPFDRFSGKLPQPFGISFTIAGDIDTTPPQVVAVTPPDGSPDVPASAAIQVAFSEPMLAPGAAGFQLLQDGNPVAGTFTINGSIGSFLPKAPLTPQTDFEISISGLTDLAGNVTSPFVSSFHTGGAPSTDRFQVVSID